MGKLKRDDDYEYGYDHLHKQKRPAAAEENDEGPVEDEDEDEAGFDETELEIGQDDYGDDEPDDTGNRESILAVERIIRETNIEPPKPLDLELPKGPHRILSWVSKAEALRRFEKAAQSRDDFDEVSHMGQTRPKPGTAGTV